jgi:uncharacterized membrane protein
MNSSTPAILWLRRRHRGTKFAILLVAAWAPFLLPRNPLVAGVLMAITSGLFFAATGWAKTDAPRIDQELPDA